VIGAADAPSAHVALRVLLTWFQTGAASLLVDGVLAAAALAYLSAAALLGHRSRAAGRERRWPVPRTGAFVAGLAIVFVAVSSGLAAYDDVNPSAHVVQHALLMMVGAPLLVAGQPLVLAAQAGPRPLQHRLVRLTGGRAAAIATGPVAWVLYLGSMAGYFLTPLYAASIRDEVLHDSAHAWFLAVGCLYWTGVLGPDVAGHRRSPARRAVLVLAGMPVEAAIGVALVVWPRPLAPGYSLTATHAAGVVFWMTAMVTSGAAVAVLAHRWIRSDERRVRRIEQSSDPIVPLPPPVVTRPADAGP
jgi:putative copper resistance protein D